MLKLQASPTTNTTHNTKEDMLRWIKSHCNLIVPCIAWQRLARILQARVRLSHPIPCVTKPHINPACAPHRPLPTHLQAVLHGRTDEQRGARDAQQHRVQRGQRGLAVCDPRARQSRAQVAMQWQRASTNMHSVLFCTTIGWESWMSIRNQRPMKRFWKAGRHTCTPTSRVVVWSLRFSYS
jgi:hypothetical protein